jgi:hypothetical protein
MSKFGEQIRAKSSSQRSRVEVAEWGDDDAPLVLYATELLCGEFNRLQKKHPDFLNNQTIEALVDLIIMKSQDADGEKVFDLEDKAILMRQPVSIVSTVAGKLMGNIDSVEELEKN